jgi:hypothetical protein
MSFMTITDTRIIGRSSQKLGSIALQQAGGSRTSAIISLHPAAFCKGIELY